MLDKEVFFNRFDELLIAYPNWKLNYDDQNTMRFWYKQFEDMEDEHFSFMVNSYMQKEKFNPTIGGLKEHDTMPRKSATQIAHEKEMQKMEEYKEREKVDA